MLAALPAAAFAAWIALAQVNFFYPLLHDAIGIDRTIEVYAPRNRYRQGFEQTSKAERERLFAAIVNAIHKHGDGLRTLVYHDASGRPLGNLLREEEIVHLQDVANLVDRLRPVGLGAVAITCALLIGIRRQRLAAPSIASLLVGLIAMSCAIAGSILILGPVKVFYRLHTLIFPPGHAWFFYYQDSLMSTMMKAPDLFGYIALIWAASTSLLLLALVFAARRAGDRTPD